MKSQFQVLTFLNQFQPNSELDHDMITAFIEKRYRITPKTVIFAQISTFSPIDTQSFLQWYENGYTALEIVKYDNKLGVLGKCDFENAEIVGILEDESVQQCSMPVNVADLSKATQEETERFLHCLSASKLQLNPLSLTLEAKYIPRLNEKVLFHSHDFAINGIGIVRDYDTHTQEVELYCYFIYPTKTEKSRLGYSMHERNIVNLYGYIFEPLLEDDSESRFSTDDGISAYRRMKRELEKAGKIWKDKLNRIEPIKVKQDKGELYWYINDKLAVITEHDTGTPNHQKRYVSGNYFTDPKAASIIQDKISQMIRNYLASPQWPEIDN